MSNQTNNDDFFALNEDQKGEEFFVVGSEINEIETTSEPTEFNENYISNLKEHKKSSQNSKLFTVGASFAASAGGALIIVFSYISTLQPVKSVLAISLLDDSTLPNIASIKCAFDVEENIEETLYGTIYTIDGTKVDEEELYRNDELNIYQCIFKNLSPATTYFVSVALENGERRTKCQKDSSIFNHYSAFASLLCFFNCWQLFVT